MESLTFQIPTSTHFGRGARFQLGARALRYGTRALLISESVFQSSDQLSEIQENLAKAGVEAISYARLGPETTSRAGEACLELAKSGHVQLIIGLGGVRALSLAKAVAALGSSIFDLDNLTDLQHGSSSVYPYIELPTTCRNPFMLGESFLLTDARNRHSSILRRRGAFADAVFIDPDLSAGLSERAQAATILETLLHSLEGFFSTQSNFLSGSIFLRSIGLATAYIDAFESRKTPDIAGKSSQAGLLSAMALTMSSLGFGSAVAFSASGLFRVPKSGIAAVMLPVVLEYARRACPEKLVRMAPIIDEDTRQMRTLAAADVVIGALRRRIDTLQLPLRLSEFGISRTDLPHLASRAASMGLGGELPIPLSEDELLEILRGAL